jgi:hypothetical protein
MGMNVAGGGRQPLHVLIESGMGSFISLEDWISWVDAELRNQSTAIDELRRQSADIGREFAALKSEFYEQLSTYSEPRDPDLRQRMDNLDQRLNDILALFEKHFGGGQTEKGMLHHDYAMEYIALVEQRILALVLEILSGSPHAAPRDKAKFIAVVCYDLFGTPEVREQPLLDRLPEGTSPPVIERARKICADVRLLREKVADGRSQRWEFGYTAGARIDEERQEAWPGSCDGGVVEFVVAPAYIVDSDTLLWKQRVFMIGGDGIESPESMEASP